MIDSAAIKMRFAALSPLLDERGRRRFRDNWLLNRVFKFYDVVEHYRSAWNKGVDQP
jgi:hypothetical protein